ncbi:MAG: hypothetical protein RBT13_00575 [Bacteroidales bacterium]|jgi:hypothetical protein|nr:hypothetical protein [Bacteroidales bacterium]
MKKLMALLVVAGMVFVSCQQKPAEEAVEAEAVVEEVAPVEEAVEAEAVVEEVAPVEEAAPAN